MRSVLLVDDETEICAELERTLRGLSFRVETADTVEKVVHVVEQSQFDVIFLEFNLRSKREPHPRTGAGLEALRRLRASGVRTPVLILTAMKGELYEKASREAGADDFILKTDGIPHLLRRLQAHIGWSEQEPGTGSAHRLGRNVPRRKSTGRAEVLPRWL